MLCPACRLVYHAECWQENLGCASYGCEQVNALAPAAPEPAAPGEPAQAEPTHDPGSPVIAWSFILLAAATISLLLAPLTFGVPSMMTLIAATCRVWKLRSARDGVLVGALVLCAGGIAAGVMLSHFWWGQAG